MWYLLEDFLSLRKVTRLCCLSFTPASNCLHSPVLVLTKIGCQNTYTLIIYVLDKGGGVGLQIVVLVASLGLIATSLILLSVHTCQRNEQVWWCDSFATQIPLLCTSILPNCHLVLMMDGEESETSANNNLYSLSDPLPSWQSARCTYVNYKIKEGRRRKDELW